MHFDKRAALVAALLVAATACRLSAAPLYNAGDKVEVREGDEWTSGTILAREGRRYRVHYGTGADALDEWMGADRLRMPGSAGTPAPAGDGAVNGAGGTAGDDGTLAPGGTFQPGEAVEYKDVFGWKFATLVRFEDGLAVVKEDRDHAPERWVELFQLRKPGSTFNFPDTPWPEDVQQDRRPRMKPMTLDQFLRDKNHDVSPATLITPDIRSNPLFNSMAYEGSGPVTFAENAAPAVKPDPLWLDPAASSETVVMQHSVSAAWRPFPTRRMDLPNARNRAQPAAPAIPFNADQLIQNSQADFFASAAPVVFSQVDRANQSNSGTKALVRQDMHAHTISGAVPLPAHMRLLAVSPDGSSILLGHPQDGNNAGTFDYLELDDSTGDIPKGKMIFLPFPHVHVENSNDTHQTMVKGAAFIDATHLITFDDNGQSVVWDLGQHRPMYSIDKSDSIALSPGGKYLAVPEGHRVVIAEALTGNSLGDVPVDGFDVKQMAFSPSGKILVLVGDTVMESWDITAGKRTASFNIEHAPRSVICLADNYVLADDVVYDLGTTLPLVEYTNLQGVRQGAGAPLWASTQRVYHARQLPDAAGLAFAQNLNKEDVFLMKAGSKVSLSCTLIGSDQQQKSARAGIERAVQESGWTVADGQPVQIVADMENGPNHDLAYHEWNDPFGRNATKVSVPDRISRLKIMYQGQVVWKREVHSGPPGEFQLQQGQSIADQVNTLNQFDYSLFTQAQFPQTLLKPHPGTGLLVTTLRDYPVESN